MLADWILKEIVATRAGKRGHLIFSVDYHVWGPVNAFLIEQDNLLLVVLCHIERNPVRAGLVATDGLVQFGR